MERRESARLNHPSLFGSLHPMNLSNLNRAVQGVILKRFPGTGVTVEFLPLQDLSFGDVGSPVLMELSSEKKVAPEELFSELEKGLSELHELTFSTENGFLNVRGPSDPEWLIEAEEISSEPSRYEILVPPSSDALPGLSWLRLASVSYMQAILLSESGHNVSLLIPGGEEIGIRGIDGFRTLLSSGRSSSGNASVEELIKCFKESSDKTFLWIPPNYIPRKEFQKLFEPAAGYRERLVVRCPDRRWLFGGDTQFGVNEARSMSDEALLNLLYYLALPLEASEIDKAVPQLEDRLNIRWAIGAALERIERLFPESRRGEKGKWTEVSELERRLLIQVRFFPHFRHNAEIRGEVTEYAKAILELLTSFARFFNDPQIRHALEKGKMTSPQIQIISGVEKALRRVVTRRDSD